MLCGVALSLHASSKRCRWPTRQDGGACDCVLLGTMGLVVEKCLPCIRYTRTRRRKGQCFKLRAPCKESQRILRHSIVHYAEGMNKAAAIFHEKQIANVGVRLRLAKM
eukprot:6473194-Amphidinium_carterae.4